jgi:hypothetical protein
MDVLPRLPGENPTSSIDPLALEADGFGEGSPSDLQAIPLHRFGGSDRAGREKFHQYG